MTPYGERLPAGIRSRFIENVNGLRMHCLEAGEAGRPVVLLLHGFPELSFSWRYIMLPLADAGYHVLAPDQRGFGHTTGWSADYATDISPYRMLNLAIDALALLNALGLRHVHAVVGHDFGSPVAGYCALLRPDVFRRVALMSAPFPGAPTLPFDCAERPASPARQAPHEWMDTQLAGLDPPRRHYQFYYCSEQANGDMLDAPQGLHDFLRAFYHSKSGDRKDNQPTPLDGFTAEQLARMPAYYIMPRNETMAQAVAPYLPSGEEIEACRWLSDDDLAVYVRTFQQTGFQGGLNWYRCIVDPGYMADLRIFSGRRIEVPACFIGGSHDWGIYQTPGSLQRTETALCRHYLGTALVPGAGHWVQQEDPQAVCGHLERLLSATSA
jgi:pimeloyl-ACP methyl ester carboxylesterase